MPWLQHNYHKVLLVLAILLALAFGYFAFTSSRELAESFELEPARQNNDTALEGKEIARKTSDSISSEASIPQATYGEENRPVDLFTSVGLVVRKGNLNRALDLENEEPIHPPIPNQWWIDNQIDPGWGDAPLRDEDSDGFSNLEEFNAKTSPTNPEEYPSLINKLRVAAVEDYAFRPLFTNEDAVKKKYGFAFEDNKTPGNKMKAGTTVVPGDLFFTDEPAKNRFRFQKVEEIEEESSTGITKRSYATLEDQKPEKKGTTYLIPYRMNSREKAEGLFIFHDFTIVFTLNAIGEEGKEFKVEENTLFALPPSNPEKGYLLKEVKATEKGEPTSVIVEYQGTNGPATLELQVPKP